MGVDANKVRLTGENSFLRLSESADAEPTASNSHWRIVHSPKGPGHVLFTKGELTGDQTRIYSDNIDMARWLQEGIQASMGDQYAGDIPIIEADFWKSGDTLSFWTEYVESRDDYITLTWYDLGEPVMMANPPRREGRPAPRRVQPAHPRSVGPDDCEWRRRVRQGASSASRRHDRHQHVLHRPIGDVDHPARPRVGLRLSFVDIRAALQTQNRLPCCVILIGVKRSWKI